MPETTNKTQHFLNTGHMILCAVLAAFVFCCSPIQANAQDFKEEQTALHDKAKDAFWIGDFSEMERLHNAYRLDDGSKLSRYARLRSVRNGFSAISKGFDGSTDLYFAELQAVTGQWAVQHPDSAFAHILHARALQARGWAFRGSGYANTIPPAALADFRKYTLLAVQYLQDHAQVVFKDTYAHVTLMELGRALDWPTDKILAISEHGLSVDPDDDKLYFEAEQHYLPKWGGSVEALDNFIRMVQERTRAKKGMTWYTRLYVAAAEDQFSHALFEVSLANWPKMKQGFEELIEREKSFSRINSFAYIACLAKDKATLKAQLKAMGNEKPDLEKWGENSERSYQSCKRFANEP